MRLLQVFEVRMCKSPSFLHVASHYSYVANAFRATVRGRFGTCANLPRFAGQKGRSRRSRALIVSLLSVYARSGAVYDMHFVPLRALFFASGVPERTWASSHWAQCFWFLDAPAIRTLLWLGHGWSGNGMLSNMNVILAWA